MSPHILIRKNISLPKETKKAELKAKIEKTVDRNIYICIHWLNNVWSKMNRIFDCALTADSFVSSQYSIKRERKTPFENSTFLYFSLTVTVHRLHWPNDYHINDSIGGVACLCILCSWILCVYFIFFLFAILFFLKLFSIFLLFKLYRRFLFPRDNYDHWLALTLETLANANGILLTFFQSFYTDRARINWEKPTKASEKYKIKHRTAQNGFSWAVATAQWTIYRNHENKMKRKKNTHTQN